MVNRTATVLAALTSSMALLTATATAATDPATDLSTRVTAEGANRHLIAFQRIADTHGGNRRTATTTGHNASVDYVDGRLREVGFDVTTPTLRGHGEVQRHRPGHHRLRNP